MAYFDNTKVPGQLMGSARRLVVAQHMASPVNSVCLLGAEQKAKSCDMLCALKILGKTLSAGVMCMPAFRLGLPG